MSVDLPNYDFSLFRGTTFKLDFKYTDGSSQGIDLSSYEAKMQVRRSKSSSQVLAELTENFPTGAFGAGPTGGDFTAGIGVTGLTGGLTLNYNGVTGDIHVEIDTETSLSMPRGKHFYDLQLTDSTGSLSTVLKGRIEVKENSYFRPRG